MDNIQRWSQDVGAMFKDEDGKWCHSDDVAKLESQNTELLGVLKSLAAAVCHLGLTEYHGSLAVTVEAARTAIAKAEGAQP